MSNGPTKSPTRVELTRARPAQVKSLQAARTEIRMPNIGYRAEIQALQETQNCRILGLQAILQFNISSNQAAQPKRRCSVSFVKNYHSTILAYDHQCLYITVLPLYNNTSGDARCLSQNQP